MRDKETLVSIVIPCFNSGVFLPDALSSISRLKKNYQVIIVDDGSSDEQTLQLLEQLKQDGYTVLTQQNLGPAAARNTGVKASPGEFIVFLDSDNMLLPGYIEQALELFQADELLGVVYANPEFFGDVSDERLFVPKDFDLTTIVLGNYIDVCAVVRKDAWNSVNGLDENRAIIGYEDWDFWMMLGTAGWKFHHIDRPFFRYRIRKDSLIKQASDRDYINRMFQYIYTKHWKLMLRQYEALYYQYEFYQADQKKPVRTFVKNLMNRFVKKRTAGLPVGDLK